MNEPKVPEMQSDWMGNRNGHIRWKRQAEGVDFFKVACLPALVIGAIVGWAVIIKVAGVWLGLW